MDLDLRHVNLSTQGLFERESKALHAPRIISKCTMWEAIPSFYRPDGFNLILQVSNIEGSDTK